MGRKVAILRKSCGIPGQPRVRRRAVSHTPNPQSKLGRKHAQGRPGRATLPMRLAGTCAPASATQCVCEHGQQPAWGGRGGGAPTRRAAYRSAAVPHLWVQQELVQEDGPLLLCPVLEHLLLAQLVLRVGREAVAVVVRAPPPLPKVQSLRAVPCGRGREDEGRGLGVRVRGGQGLQGATRQERRWRLFGSETQAGGGEVQCSEAGAGCAAGRGTELARPIPTPCCSDAAQARSAARLREPARWPLCCCW